MQKLLFFIVIAMVSVSTAAETPPFARQIAEAASPDGRIHAEWKVSPVEPQLSDTILLTLEIQAETSLQVEMPVFGSALGELEITDISERTIGIAANRETKQIILKAVPKHGGKTPIWQTPIRYSDKREGLQKKKYSITVPAAELEINAAVSPETASLDKITESREIFDIRSHHLIVFAVFLVILIAVTLFLIFCLRRKSENAEGKSLLSPQEIALQRLAILIDSRLYEIDVKKFFIELTGIVRWYIEQQTDIRAPELTTEEFLHEITEQWKRRAVLPPELQDRLRLFLESADMVKFAKFQPSPEEIMLGVRRAKEFISMFAPQDDRGTNC